MTNNPLISVIVPVYNVENYIDECLNSIRQQTYQHLEIIIVEDCSTDNSSQLLQAHLEDQRIKILQHEKNSGLSAARNTGIEAASGEYMMFVDSDDIVDSNLVNTCFVNALKSKADVVLFTEKPFQNGHPVQKVPELQSRHDDYKALSEKEYFEYPHFAWLKFIRAELMLNKNLRFPVNQYYEDWPFHWEMGFITSNIVAINHGYYHYRQRSDSITGSGDVKLLHILSADRLVMRVTEKYSTSLETKKVLSSKINSDTWFVLNNIDKQYLEKAIVSAKEHLKVSKAHRQFDSPSPQIRLLLLVLKLPTPISTSLLTFLRDRLKQLFRLWR